MHIFCAYVKGSRMKIAPPSPIAEKPIQYEVDALLSELDGVQRRTLNLIVDHYEAALATARFETWCAAVVGAQAVGDIQSSVARRNGAYAVADCLRTKAAAVRAETGGADG
jgi:hypothetical protein